MWFVEAVKELLRETLLPLPMTVFFVNVAKYVREHHVQTDKHWSNGLIEKNKLDH